MTTFVEITSSDHGHGGEGWEFGTCLWSPSRNRTGQDRYSLMRAPLPGDEVVHIYRTIVKGVLDTFLIGTSHIASSYTETTQKAPPKPGAWAQHQSYYRIELKDYLEYESPLLIRTLLTYYADEIKDDLRINQPRFYPFNTHGDSIRTVQGIYLARCTPTLLDIIARAIGISSVSSAAEPNDFHNEYSEGRRLAKERYFFARNPQLVKEAKRIHGLKCCVCGFEFRMNYGPLGEGFIEMHHVSPLAERAEREWADKLITTAADVVPVCSNCHRMIHRTKPAMSPAELTCRLTQTL